MFFFGRGKSITVVRFADGSPSCRPRTRDCPGARAGSPSETSRTLNLHCGGDSDGGSAGEALTSADVARSGGVLTTRVSFAASASRRRYSEAASARRSDRQTRLLSFASILAAGATSAKTFFPRTNQIKAFELRTNYMKWSFQVDFGPRFWLFSSFFGVSKKSYRLWVRSI